MIRTARLLFLVLALTGPTTLTLAGEVMLDGRTLTLPDGFTLERAAGPPLVDRPITADFDERGRLYVADSSGSNDKVAVQLEQKPHRILRLDDSDGDGRFDRRTVFADHMMFPEGTMWLDGSLYVSAPPSIWKLTDTNDDGVADERVEWYQGKTLTGCANDLHGPYRGPDGWIYFCKGAFAEQTHERPGKAPFVSRAAHIFRCRPDGSGLEPVMTGGMDNPVDVVFTPGGERIFTTTFLQSPANGRRDGLIHAIYGGVYGKVNGVLDGHIRTGPDLMPVLSHLGAAAPSGLEAYDSNAFGDEYRDNLFTCCFNMQKVLRTVLTPSGATFTSRDEPFLSTLDRDFHPTDVVEDADGSLLVLDTGGWYKLCCPSSQIHKPDVLGVIYRIRRTDTSRIADPRGLALDWNALTPERLIALLDDPRPAVRERAVATLGKMGPACLDALKTAFKASSSPRARRNLVSVATRIDQSAARELVRLAFGDSDDNVRQTAIHSASLWRDQGATGPLTTVLESLSFHDRRAAAEALGRIGDVLAVPALLEASSSKANDRILEHSLTYALIEIGHPEAIAKALDDTKPGARRVAIVALDQLNALSVDKITADLSSGDASTRSLAWWIAGRHPEWAETLSTILRKRLSDTTLSDADRTALVEQLTRLASAPAIQATLARALSEPGSCRQTALKAMAGSGVKAMPAVWSEGLSTLLKDGDRDALTTIRALPVSEPLAPALHAVADDPKASAASRLDALGSIPTGFTIENGELFAFLRSQLDPTNPVTVRTAAANVLSHAKLTNEQLSELTELVKTAGPLEIDKLLTAFETSNDEAVGMKLLAALKSSSVRSSLRVDMIKPRIDKFGPSVRERADDLYASLNVDAASQKAKLESLLPALASGDVRRGQLVFNGVKAACLTCHAVGYLGGKVGPDLSRIGEIRSERDLLESILFPSLSFVRSYEPLTVATKDGKLVNGILRKDSADEVVLAVNATDETRIPRDEVEEIRPGTASVMPAGLDQQLTKQELADLIAFLKSRK